MELIFDTDAFLQNLPYSIEAVFIIKPSDAKNFGCDNAKWFFVGDKLCNGYAHAARRRMLQHFGLTKEELPLVEFDPWNTKHPFRAVD